MGVRDYLVDADEIAPSTRPEAPPKVRADPREAYSVEECSGPDLVVARRRAGRRVDRLCLIVSADTYYVEEGGRKVVVDETSLGRFLGGLRGGWTWTGPAEVSPVWEGLAGSTAYARGLAHLLDASDPDATALRLDMKALLAAVSVAMVEALGDPDRNGLLHVVEGCSPHDLEPWGRALFRRALDADPEAEPAVYRRRLARITCERALSPYYMRGYLEAHEADWGTVRSALMVGRLFAPEKGAALMDAWLADDLLGPIDSTELVSTLLTPRGGRGEPADTRLYSLRISRLTPTRAWLEGLPSGEGGEGGGSLTVVDTDPDRLVEWLGRDRLVAGYADDSYRYLQTWCDVLRMQVEVYGEVRERYPRDLDGMHARLSYRCNVIAKARAAEAWKEAQPGLDELEAASPDGRYVLVAPKSPLDMVEEATAQSNCVASYVQRVAERRTRVAFLRRASAPGTSWGTAEFATGSDGRPVLVQLKMARNAMPNAEMRGAARAVVKALGGTVATCDVPEE